MAVTFLPKAWRWRVWLASVPRAEAAPSLHSHPGGCPSSWHRTRSPCRPVAVFATCRVTASRLHFAAGAKPSQRRGVGGRASKRTPSVAASGAHYHGDVKNGREVWWMGLVAAVTVRVWCAPGPPSLHVRAGGRDVSSKLGSASFCEEGPSPYIGPSSMRRNNDSLGPNLTHACRC